MLRIELKILIDDYYPCMKKDCCLLYVYQWMILFTFMYNAVKSHFKFSIINEAIGDENP
jgi:hypothetical protein